MTEIPAQDLGGDPLLEHLNRDTVSGQPIIGGIPLISKIGEGSDSAVYFAKHPKLGREIAVKIMPTSGLTRERLLSFEDAAMTALTIKSPHLVELIEAGSDGSLFFTAAEYLVSESAQEYLNRLRERLKPGMDELAVLECAIPVASGLATIHKASMLHSCMRPSSILIPKAKDLYFTFAKLDDFGTAYKDSKTMRSGNDTGIPGFMSPEQAQSNPNPTPASDVFSMGAVLYNLLAGQPPFGGFSLNSVLAATVSQEPGDLRTWRPDVSRATVKTIMLCLSKVPTNRFPDGNALLNALKICHAAINGTTDVQVTAIDQIEALIPAQVSEVNAMLEKVLADPGLATEPEPEGVVDQTAVQSAAPMDAEPAPVPLDAPAEILVPVESAPQPIEASEETPSHNQDDGGAHLEPRVFYRTHKLTEGQINPPEENESRIEEPVEFEAPPRRSLLPVLAVAVVLLAIGAAAVWKLGLLGTPQKPAAQAPVLASAAQIPPPAGVTPEKPDTAKLDAQKQKADEIQHAKEAKEKEQQELEAKHQAELKAQAEEAKANEARALEVKRLAEEKQKQEEKTLAELKLKAEEEARAKEAQALLEAKALAEKKIADEKRKAEQERLEVEAARIKKEEDEKARVEALRLAEEKRKAEAKAAEERAATELQANLVKEQARLAKEAKEKTASAQKEKLKQFEDADGKPLQEIHLDLGEGIKMDFVRVPAGSFMMGSDPLIIAEIARRAGADPADFADESPAHKVQLSTFYIGKTPVTVAQFNRFVSAANYATSAEKVGVAFTLCDKTWQRTPGACWRIPGFTQDQNHPVTFLNQKDCLAYAEWAAKQVSLPLRLPTEQEWEYAARGPRGAIYPWGDAWDGKLANHSDLSLKVSGPETWDYSPANDGFAFTSPVGHFSNRSWCGALDMAGNVFQWCADQYQGYPGSTGIQLGKGVLRGGSFLFRPIDCRSAARHPESIRAASCDHGMRLAFSIPEAN